MYELKDVFQLSNVVIWSNGYRYNTQDKRCDIQDAYMQQNEKDIKSFYDGLDATHRKILTQIISQVLHYDDFTKFLSLTVIANAKVKVFKDALDWVNQENKNTYDEEKKLRKENEVLRNQLKRETGLKKDLAEQLHDVNYRMKQIKELVF